MNTVNNLVLRREYTVRSWMSPESGTNGATMLECAMILPLLLVLIFIILELSRYWAVQGLINQGAQRGLNLAVKVVNLQFEYDNSSSEAWQNYQNFLKVRQTVIEEAESLPSAAFVKGHDSTGAARFVGFEGYPVPNGSATVNAALLRPGECVDDQLGVRHCHPTLCPPNEPDSPSCPASTRRRVGGTSMETLLETYPVVIVMPVEFKSLVPLPMFRVFHPAGMAAGYREIARTGAYPPPEDGDPQFVPPTATPTDPDGDDDDDDDDDDPPVTPEPDCVLPWPDALEDYCEAHGDECPDCVAGAWSGCTTCGGE